MQEITRGIILELMSKAATVAFALCHCLMYTLSLGLKQWWIETSLSADNIKYVSKKNPRQVNSVTKTSGCVWNCQWKLPFVNHNHFKRVRVLCETIISCFVHSLWSTREISYSFITVVKELYSMDVVLPNPKLMAHSREKGFLKIFYLAYIWNTFPG